MAYTDILRKQDMVYLYVGSVQSNSNKIKIQTMIREHGTEWTIELIRSNNICIQSCYTQYMINLKMPIDNRFSNIEVYRPWTRQFIRL